MNNQDSLNGLQHSLLEIDDQLRELAPQLERRMHREVIRGQVDELLDQRNLVTSMMGELVVDEYTELMEAPDGTS